jgi:hypothetical protein
MLPKNSLSQRRLPPRDRLWLVLQRSGGTPQQHLATDGDRRMFM